MIAAPALLLIAACAYQYDAPRFGVVAPPQSFAARPAVIHPVDNPPSDAKVALGQALFADPGLSGAGTLSCASCHVPDKAFTDGLPTARGIGGRPLLRNTPTIINSAHMPALFWDGRSPNLEDQALRPAMSGGEMGRHPAILADAIAADPRYRPMFAAAFPGEPVSEVTIAKAIAAYERTLVSGVAPFDRWLAGDREAISPEAARGFTLFAGKANCAACHSGWLMSDGRFHDVGLEDDDLGRGGITNNKAFDHAFRTPSLREIGRTAPYMHDGSLKSLAEVVDHYADLRVKRSGTPPKVTLTPVERAELVAFLGSLDSDAVR
jgi:cytochrome c peroxidase